MSEQDATNISEQQRAALEAMRMVELQALAADLQIVGAGRLRKGELVDAVSGAQSGAAPVAAMPPTKRRVSRRVSAADPAGFVANEGAMLEHNAATAGHATSGLPEAIATGTHSDDDATAVVSDGAGESVSRQETARSGRRRASEHASAGATDTAGHVSADANPEDAGTTDIPSEDASASDDRATDQSGEPEGAGDSTDSATAAEGAAGSNRNRRNRNRNRNGTQSTQTQQNGAAMPSGLETQGGTETAREEDDAAARGRSRDRKRGRTPGSDETDPEILADDVLIPIAGILDVLDNYAFVRTTGYLSGPTDIYVSLGQVKKYGMRKGDAVVGAIRQPRENEQHSRQKYSALAKVDSVNGQGVQAASGRPEFTDLTAVHPTQRLRLETAPENFTGRILDMFAPIGKGQRALIVGAPGSGKTQVIREIATAIAANSPDVHLMVVLVDSRPEEVTMLRQNVKGEVIASAFDRGAEDHVTIADLAIERAKRLVELGHDVAVLIDSVSRLTRAQLATVAASGRGTAAGAAESLAVQPVKRLFAAARKIEEGGSLTIVATALSETGVRGDELTLEELAGAATMQLQLAKHLAEREMFPAVRLIGSRTHLNDALMGTDEAATVAALRRDLADRGKKEALQSVLEELAATGSNAEFLARAMKSHPRSR